MPCLQHRLPCSRSLWLTGWNAGWILTCCLVGNLAYLHGWMNLYNNGFSAGFIAAILVGILEILRKKIKKSVAMNRKELSLPIRVFVRLIAAVLIFLIITAGILWFKGYSFTVGKLYFADRGTYLITETDTAFLVFDASREETFLSSIQMVIRFY